MNFEEVKFLKTSVQVIELSLLSKLFNLFESHFPYQWNGNEQCLLCNEIIVDSQNDINCDPALKSTEYYSENNSMNSDRHPK